MITFIVSGIGSQDTPSARRLTKTTMSKLKKTEVTTTTKEYSDKMKMQIGKYFYATNTPFDHANHKEFKNMMAVLRPGFMPPSAYEISNPILDKMYEETLSKCKEKVKNKTVCMSLDGWSNVHNEPLICCSITTPEGKSVLVDIQCTSVDRHTSKNLKNVALNAIKYTEKHFGVKVKSFVTDNAANVQKMREELSQKDGINIIPYECSAHILNLLAQDLEVPEVTAKIYKVVKYFRNKPILSALYKQAGGKKLVVPKEVRWNTMNDSIRSYLDNRGILVKLCQDCKEHIDNDIIIIVNDTAITANAVDLLKTFTPIAIALEKMQRNCTTIAVAVEIWNKLESELKDQPAQVKVAFLKRRKLALYGAHYVANMLDHRFLGQKLMNDQKEEAFAYINGVDPRFVPFIMAFITKSDPFPKYMFGKHFRHTSPMLWWNSLSLEDEIWPRKEKFLSFCEQLMTAIASTGALERCCSSFGLVQSELRDRLGNDKAAKLIFIFKYFNQQTENYNTDLSSILNFVSSDTVDPSITAV